MKKVFLIVTVLYCISCNKNSLNSFYSKGLINDYPNNLNYNYYVIIPQAGCPGCISNAEDFLLKNKNSTKYLFVITNYFSLKALRLKLGKDIMDFKNIILDSTNNYYNSNFEESIYPISIQLKGNVIEQIIVGTP